MKAVTILTTDRLILRTWTQEDVSQMAEISSDPVVMEYFPYLQDLAATQKLVDHVVQQQEEYGYSIYAVEVKATNEFIGFVGLNHPSYTIPNFKPNALPIVEICWRLSSKYWNKGYATEAAKAVLHYAFSVLNLEEVISFTTVKNIRSRRVMEKIGLHCSAEDDFLHPNIEDGGALRPHVLYRMDRSAYLGDASNI